MKILNSFAFYKGIRSPSFPNGSQCNVRNIEFLIFWKKFRWRQI